MEITGAQLVVKALKAEKTDTLFAYPGGQVIDLFNELYDEKEIRVITPRHEQGLVHAADGYARASGKTGVCIVTSGPGTTNLVTGIATANIDSVPLVCFTGQVSSGLIGRESFQEVNTIKIMKSICKYVVTVRDRSEGVHIAGAEKEMASLAEKTGIPVVTTIMGKGVLPSDHPLYMGNLGIHGSFAANMATSECDVLFAIGTRFNDRITGKTDSFADKAVIIHADIEPDVISRNVPADISVAADAGKLIRILLERAKPSAAGEWVSRLKLWKQRHPVTLKKSTSGEMSAQNVIEYINDLFDSAVITTDVGQNQMWASQFLKLSEKRKMLTSGGMGTMGYGFPAAIGAKLGVPRKDVIAICGDGGFQMNIQELATAALYELPIIICIFNNGYLGNVRQWQEMFYDRRYSATCTCRRESCMKECKSASAHCLSGYIPDFVHLAQSYGAEGIRVREVKDIRSALLKAKESKNVPTVIEFIIGREQNVLPIVPPGNSLENMIGGE